jgi:hypothetical protein
MKHELNMMGLISNCPYQMALCTILKNYPVFFIYYTTHSTHNHIQNFMQIMSLEKVQRMAKNTNTKMDTKKETWK